MQNIRINQGGREIWLNGIRESDIDIRDISSALSKICRYGGRLKDFYSVAQHSIIVSNLCEPEYALAGLLHDAAEAYIGDIISPIKKQLTEFLELEQHIEHVIWRKFGLLDTFEKYAHEIKACDITATQAEMMYFYYDGERAEILPISINGPEIYMAHFAADREFMKRYCELIQL